MKRTVFGNRLLKAYLLLLLLTPAGTTAWATTHVVKFGGSAGFKYVPATLSAAVGDTVKWEGDFSVHPISSTTIPSGSQSWHASSGSSFSYTIAVAGAYNYKCDVHAGMTGSFQAGASGIGNSLLPPGRLETGKQTAIASMGSERNLFVNITLPRSGPAVLKIIDLNGRERGTLLNRVLSQGTYSIPFAGMPSDGIYYIRLNCNGGESGLMFNGLR
jgi:plastocyanin